MSEKEVDLIAQNAKFVVSGKGQKLIQPNTL